MTEGSDGRRTDKGTATGGTRNKRTDAYGNGYDCRSGSWSGYDEAIRDEWRILNGWLTRARCAVELRILNPPGKPGRKFEYPPSLIQYLLMQKESGGASYRAGCARCAGLLEGLGLAAPSYSTLHKSEMRFFGGGLGTEVMEKASAVLAEMGVAEEFDPVVFLRSGAFPEYSAPQKIPVCQRDVEEQASADAEAAGMREMMEVMVSKEHASHGRRVEGAADGSGEGTTGSGIYMEHIWGVGDRCFVKQHALVDTVTMDIVAFSVTMETPGDAKVLPPLIEGCRSMGVGLAKVTADSAYDTRENWRRAADAGVEFVPNLKATFRDDSEIPERRELRLLEERLGKSTAHRVTGYSLRWLVESFFSAFKRLYGDRVSSRKFARMVLTMRTRYILYAVHRRTILKHVSGHRLDDCLMTDTHESRYKELFNTVYGKAPLPHMGLTSVTNVPFR